MEINTKNNSEDFIYLFELQQSGRTNMFGAGAFLERERGVESKKARRRQSHHLTATTETL